MKNKSYDKKTFRLISILNKLDSQRQVSSSVLAEEFNVSIRTIQRDLELLNMTGFLLDSPQKGLYKFSEGFSLKKMKLTNEEASLLTVLFEMTKSLGKDFEDSFRKILAKVFSQEYDSPFYIKMPASLKIPKGYPFMKVLEEAIDSCQKIKVSYKGHEKEGEYIICPLKIIFFDGFWYLLANPEDKSWLVKFRLEDIKEVKIVGGHFMPPANLKTILNESVNIFFSDKRDKKVIVRVNKEAARYFQKKSYFPLQKITKINKDGSLKIETRVSHFMEVILVVLRWIPYVEVESPKELKEEVRQIIEGYLKKI
jgi:predicted DNA-binding transcriptional regulator YafY